MANEDLHEWFKALQKEIHSVHESIKTAIGEVEKVREAITSGVEEIVDAIYENARAQAEMKLLERMMEVKQLEPQLEAERKQIERERTELNDLLERIEERYERKHEELDETAAERVRELGSHIFPIQEDQFEAGIEDPFADQVTRGWQRLRTHNTAVRERRRSAVERQVDETIGAVESHVSQRENLRQAITDRRLPAAKLGVSTEGVTPVQVPHYVIEYTVDGTTQRELVVPGTVESRGGQSTVGVSSFPGVERLFDGSIGPDRHTGKLEARTVSRQQIRASTVASELSSYTDAGLGRSYTDLVADTIDGSVPVEREGGEH